MRAVLMPVLAALMVAPAAAQRVEAPVPARTVEGFAPHRATYDLTLKRTRWSANVASLTGRLVSEFDDVCEGFTYNQRLMTNFTDVEGKVANGNYWVSTYETSDGSSFRFTLSNAMSGQPVEKVEGAASRAAGGAGEASYENPRRKKVDLPAGIVFPTEFQGRTIEAARSGKRSLALQIFEGDAEGRVFDVFIAIGVERQANEAELALPGGEVLRGVRAWPMSVSYYVRGKSQDLPDYETSFTLFENGISTGITLDYGDFALSGQLRRIDTVKRPRC